MNSKGVHMKNLNLQNLAACCNGKLLIPEDFENTTGGEASSVVTDSRQVVENSVFIAIPGERVDGHNFVADVLKKGALAAVVEHEVEDAIGPQIVVENSAKALAKIGAFYRSQLEIPIVGITGSVGKTSTKEMIASVLAQHFKVQKTAGNFNNEIGLPLTLCTIGEEHEVAITEMGISDFGEMTRLSEMSRPNIFVMTNIGICHLENLGTRDGILKAKTESFANLSDNATVVLNGDDDKLCTIKEVQGKAPIFYGIGRDKPEGAVYDKKSVWADEIDNLGLGGVDFTIHINDKSYKAHTSLPGEHNVYNACAAAAVGITLGMSIDEILQGIALGQTIAGRSNIISVEKDNKKYTVIDDCYNANPVSMRASIDVLATAKGRKIAVLGDMGELGVDEKKLHYEIGEYAANSSLDVVFLTGELSKEMVKALEKSDKELHYCEDKQELMNKLTEYVAEGDTVLIKASHFMGYDQLVRALR